MATEVDVYLAYLNNNRNSVIRKLDGVDEAQLRTSLVPSGTNLLGLVQHLAGVEVHWFCRVFNGEKVIANKSMQVPAEASSPEVIDSYRRVCARSDEIVRSAAGPEVLSAIPNPGEDQRDPLRSVLAHLIEETARHAGHADILREQLDGTTGN